MEWQTSIIVIFSYVKIVFSFYESVMIFMNYIFHYPRVAWVGHGCPKCGKFICISVMHPTSTVPSSLCTELQN